MCAEAEMPIRPRRDFEEGMEPEIYEIQVVDMFGESLRTQENFGLIFGTETSSVDMKLDPWGNGVVPAFILAQLIPCAPSPSRLVSSRLTASLMCGARIWPFNFS
jgi:hypothetical protein